MNFIKKYFLFLPIAMLFAQCHSGTETDVYDLDELKITYANNIRLPYDSIDLLICNPALLCGNTSEAELRTFFVPYLPDEPYKSILAKKYTNTRIVKAQYSPDTIAEDNSSRKMFIEFWGTRTSRDTVQVKEVFHCGNEENIVEKLCTYKDGKWSVVVQ